MTLLPVNVMPPLGACSVTVGGLALTVRVIKVLRGAGDDDLLRARNPWHHLADVRAGSSSSATPRGEKL